MPDDTTESLKRVAASLEEVAGLLRQVSEERKALAKAFENRPERLDHSEHVRRIDALRKEAEQKHAKELEFRTALLKAIEEQAAILQRIETLLSRPT
jgi:DNA repair ATPase RecN